jgi:hypothetical protein
MQGHRVLGFVALVAVVCDLVAPQQRAEGLQLRTPQPEFVTTSTLEASSPPLATVLGGPLAFAHTPLPPPCVAASACSCLCSERNDTASVHARHLLPHCRSSMECWTCAEGRSAAVASRPNAAVVIPYSFDRNRVRIMHQKQPLSAYLKDMTLALRLVLSLRRVRTVLPIFLCLSGERRSQYERLFTSLGVSRAVSLDSHAA